MNRIWHSGKKLKFLVADYQFQNYENSAEVKKLEISTAFPEI